MDAILVLLEKIMLSAKVFFKLFFIAIMVLMDWTIFLMKKMVISGTKKHRVIFEFNENVC